MLCELGFIAFANLNETNSSTAESILPTKPADHLLVNEVSNKFELPLSDWLKDWPPAHSKGLQIIVQRLHDGAKNTDATTFSTLLASR